jgi:NAD(P)-dependent dehydrogenase (short-subunit alcohol dehydrogenase family)
MRTNPELSDGSRGSVVLTSSTAGYFGGTGVVAYVTSKHGVIGLLRSSQATANMLGVRLNAVAPTLTPTHMTSGYSKAWLAAGLPSNQPQDVAAAITQLSVDPSMKGTCCLVGNLFLNHERRLQVV